MFMLSLSSLLSIKILYEISHILFSEFKDVIYFNLLLVSKSYNLCEISYILLKTATVTFRTNYETTLT